MRIILLLLIILLLAIRSYPCPVLGLANFGMRNR